jgi:DNA repair photolyase
MMDIQTKEVASILTPQHNGFLASAPYPFTHALSTYTGCAFGQTTCGLYCYAQFLPNWRFRSDPTSWGKAVDIKMNAAELLDRTLARMSPATRQRLRIFMSSTTDPYQPVEQKYRITRRCLEVFAHYTDLDLLVIQTRSPLAQRDLALMQQIPYAYLSVTIETDNQNYLKTQKGGPPLEKRWELLDAAHKQQIATQVTVSPCLPLTNIECFGQHLLNSGARRLIVDTTIDGDGQEGQRTAHSPFAHAEPRWHDTTQAHQLYAYLKEQAPTTGVAVGWSVEGFCGISFRQNSKQSIPEKLF